MSALKKFSFVLVLSLFTMGAVAQKFNLDQFKNWKPRNIGPSGMSGRITTIDAVVADPNTIWIGAASGGVWKTNNAGGSWESVFEDQPILNIGSIAIQQSNPSTVWVGTGEGNPRNSVSLGEGMYKTIDGGKTWKRVGLEKTRNIHRVIIDPTNPNTVYAGAIGNPYAEHPERGVFKTTDGGETWNKILFTNDTSGVADMIMDPSNPNKLFVAMWQHRRTPWSLSSGGPGSGLFMTFDAGKTWKKLGAKEGLPDGNLGRIGLAISRSNPNRVYALVEATKNGLYKSDDGGLNWTLMNSNPEFVSTRPFYFQEIACDPQNENRLWLIYQMISKSEDAGKNFEVVIPYNGIHPDHHAFWIHPNNPNFIIDGNDGGIGITRDKGKTWIFDEKIPVGQFYHINVDNETPYHVMGGMQDNGTWHGPAYTWMSGGIKNYYWENIWGGDGFDAMPDPDDASWIYAMSQGGSVGKYNYKTGESWYMKPPQMDEKTMLRFNWNAAMAQDPTNNSTIYYGSQFLHKSTNKGASWETISPDLTTNDSAKIDQTNNGGISIDITGAENYCTILTIAPSSKDKNVIWVGTDDGNVQLTRDGGKTWTNFRGKIPGLPVGAWIPQVQASRYNAGEAFVVANDYRRGDFKPYIFRTNDYGKTWTRLADEKKVIGYALCVLQDPTEPNLIFAGTEQGLWVSLDNGASFQQWKNGYPSVSTYDLTIQEREADLVIATFGRALWVLDDIRPLRKLASAKGDWNKSFASFPNGNTIQASYKNAPGYEWSTWGIWDAPNRPAGAAISYYLKPSTDTTKKKDSVMVKIFNDKNEIVRNLKWSADSGFNRKYWGMEEKGFRTPGGGGRGRRGGAAGADEPAGQQALPGTYKVVLKYQNNSDSTFVTLLDDPRIGNRNTIKEAQASLRNELKKSGDKLVEAMDLLTEADNATKKVETYIKDMSGKEVDSLKKSTKKVQDEVKKLRESITGKPQTKQGYGQVPTITVMNTYQQASMSIASKPIAPGAQEKRLVENAAKLIEEAVKRVHAFKEGTWKSYQELVTATKLSPFEK
ncbi:MAG: WD40/YVTN/BNR-like repeat-containing protein [Bacteroidota bacterium]